MGRIIIPLMNVLSLSASLSAQLLADFHESWSMSASSLNSGNVTLHSLSFYISVFWVLAQSLHVLSQTLWTFLLSL